MIGLFLLLHTACTDEKDTSSTTSETEEQWAPDYNCPGDPQCETAEGPLKIGAAALPITPLCFENWLDCGEDGLCPGDDGYTEPDGGEGDGRYRRAYEVYLDCGCDRICPGDEGYTAPDSGEADGVFQASWLAGFHNGRPANGIHDDLWIRVFVLEKGETRVAFGVVDLIGWFIDDIEITRDLIADAGIDLDHLIVASTHNHESPDTVGLWGLTSSSGGVDNDYSAYVRTQTAAAVEQAIANLEEVGSMTIGSVDVGSYSEEKGTSLLVRDSRDPVVIDENLSAAIFRNTSGETIATLSHFGNHPEAMADENLLITSDFADPLRNFLEDGVEYDSYSREGYGGTSIFINGTVGGLMTPLGITIVDGEGNEWRDYTFERNDVFGKVMAEMAMDAIESGDQVTTDIPLRVTGKKFKLPVENWGFQAMFLSGIIERELMDYDPEEVLGDDNLPYVETEISHLQIGPLSLVTVPGEFAPELWLGGYDGSHVGDPNKSVINPDNPNPPDLSKAPEGPYLRDMVPNEHLWLVGMGNDFLGYILPEFDFILDDNLPWFDQPSGDHYCETNSLGPQTAGLILEQWTALLDWEARQ